MSEVFINESTLEFEKKSTKVEPGIYCISKEKTSPSYKLNTSGACKF
jgi:hypothetical protein